MEFNSLPPLPDGWVRLYLCRHGETFANAAKIIQGQGFDSELNENGTNQAAKLGEHFKDVPLAALYSSPLKRAKQTANAIKQAHQDPSLEHQIVQEIAEMNYGDWEGVTIKELFEDIGKLAKNWASGNLSASAPKGECPYDVLKRGRSGIVQKILESSQPNQHVAAVAHGRFNKIFLSEVSGAGLQHHAKTPQINCCVNVLDYEPGTDELVMVAANLTSHL